MGEVVPARTSPTLLPHPLALCCHYPVSKCPSASIVATSTVRVNLQQIMFVCLAETPLSWATLAPHRHIRVISGLKIYNLVFDPKTQLALHRRAIQL